MYVHYFQILKSQDYFNIYNSGFGDPGIAIPRFFNLFSTNENESLCDMPQESTIRYTEYSH